VLRSTVSGGSYSSIATGITSLTYTDSGLTKGKTYYYVFSAANCAGTSVNSSQAYATAQ
jgi:cellulose 1,4-beta-cellobiosidase